MPDLLTLDPIYLALYCVIIGHANLQQAGALYLGLSISKNPV